ncbi:MAG: hypothetical protein A4E51_01937 [Methanosaeta sp. PtaU1.Bin055]|nr:MAG: hypothetical protein A4E51_01937 [Methanosaeta sp. PtaU1.Bin055]
MNRFSGTKNRAPLSSHMIWSISRRREFAPTPPTRSTSFFSAWARARSETSTSMAKAVSWKEEQTSARSYFFAAEAAAVERPEKEKSIPLTT